MGLAPVHLQFLQELRDESLFHLKSPFQYAADLTFDLFLPISHLTASTTHT